MCQDKIESRRAFMKKFPKLAGLAMFAVPFVTPFVKDAVAASDSDKSANGCQRFCTGACSDYCVNSCTGKCDVCCCGSCKENSR